MNVSLELFWEKCIQNCIGFMLAGVFGGQLVILRLLIPCSRSVSERHYDIDVKSGFLIAISTKLKCIFVRVRNILF
jgi:membrane-associated phospholipid phosphatase